MVKQFVVQLECPRIVAAIFICGIGGTFQYGTSISSLTSPAAFIQDLVNSSCRERYGLVLHQEQISLIWSFIVSVFCIGGLVSALFTNALLSRLGRSAPPSAGHICNLHLLLLDKSVTYTSFCWTHL
uniref:Uncharacterized protein n=1 Tax=Knipowitschia caucasica TaxID=637954 RepID=A0AAV2J306_KNICA